MQSTLNGTAANVTLPLYPEYDREGELLSILFFGLTALFALLTFLLVCVSCLMNARKKLPEGGGGSSEPREASVVFRSISVQWGEGKKSTLVLDDVSGYVHPREMLAIMGPSGSGKTTLLNTIAGSPDVAGAKLTGSLTLNGTEELRSLVRQNKCGYVPQMATLPNHLTVEETASMYAMFQLGTTMSRAERKEHVDRVLELLDLSHVRHNRLTSDGGGLSGGQAKRLMVACHGMMRASTKLLICDEPTTGLSSTDSHKVMSVLKRLAVDEGYSVIVTIHQPSSAIFDMFDNVLVLARSHCAYFGNPDRKAVKSYMRKTHRRAQEQGCFVNVSAGENLADVLIDAVSHERQGGAMLDVWAEDHKEKFCEVLFQKQRFEALEMGYGGKEGGGRGSSKERARSGLLLVPFAILCFVMECSGWLYMTTVVSLRDRSLVVRVFFFILLYHVLVSFFFLQIDSGDVFDFRTILSISFLIGNTPYASHSVMAAWFATMKPVLELDSFRGYYSSAAFGVAWLIVAISRVFVNGVLTMWPAYFMIGFSATWQVILTVLCVRTLFQLIWHFMILGFVSLTGILALSMMTETVLLVVNATYCGLFVVPDKIPPFMEWLHFIVPGKWALEAIAYQEAKRRSFDCDGAACPIPGEVLLQESGFRDRLALDIAILLMVVMLLVMVYIFALLLREVVRSIRSRNALGAVPAPEVSDNDSRSFIQSLDGLERDNTMESSYAIIRRRISDVLPSRFAVERKRADTALNDLFDTRRRTVGQDALRNSHGLAATLGEVTGAINQAGRSLRDSARTAIGGGGHEVEGAEKAAEDMRERKERREEEVDEINQEVPMGGLKPTDSDVSMDVCEILSFGVTLEHFSVYRLCARSWQCKWPCYPRTRMMVVSDANLHFEAGKMHAVMGPSGSGKTTMLKALAGIGEVEITGSVYLNGQLWNRSLVLAGVAKFLRQHECLWPLFTVREYIQFASDLQMRGRRQHKKEFVKALVSLLQLEHRLDNRVTELSGGQQKRVALAVDVLLSEARVLLLDEPTSGLSSADSAELICLLLFLTDRWGYTVIMTIHQPRQRIFNSFHSITTMRKGCVVGQASPVAFVNFFRSIGASIRESGAGELLLDQVETEGGSIAMQEYFEVLGAESGIDRRPGGSGMEFVSEYKELVAPYWVQAAVLSTKDMRFFLRRPGLIIIFTAQLLFTALLLGLMGFRLDDTASNITSFLGLASQWMLAQSFIYASLSFQKTGAWDVRHHDRTMLKYNLVVSEAVEAIFSYIRIVLIIAAPQCLFYFLIGLRDNWVYFFTFTWALLLLAACVEATFTLFYFFSHSLVRSMPILLSLLQVWNISSGYYVFPSNMPVWLAWLRWINPSFYATAILFSSVLENRVFECDGSELASLDCPVYGNDILTDGGFELDFIVWSMAILIGMTLLLRVLAVLAERRYERRNVPTYTSRVAAVAYQTPQVRMRAMTMSNEQERGFRTPSPPPPSDVVSV